MPNWWGLRTCSTIQTVRPTRIRAHMLLFTSVFNSLSTQHQRRCRRRNVWPPHFDIAIRNCSCAPGKEKNSPFLGPLIDIWPRGSVTATQNMRFLWNFNSAAVHTEDAAGGWLAGSINLTSALAHYHLSCKPMFAIAIHPVRAHYYFRGAIVVKEVFIISNFTPRFWWKSIL